MAPSQQPDPARSHTQGAAQTGPTGQGNPWIGVRFTCANQYVRVYRKPEATGYTARCPKCAKCVRFRVGQGGSDARFFDVSC